MGNGGDDAALVDAWRRGDPGAARRVIARHGPAMMRVALALCPRTEDAEDAVQEALLRAHRSLASFETERGSLRGWLVTVTVNCARQVRRGLARYGRLLAGMRRQPYATAVPPTTHPDLAYARERLASLPAREREAFVLVEIEELNSTQAAQAMRISASTVPVPTVFVVSADRPTAVPRSSAWGMTVVMVRTGTLDPLASVRAARSRIVVGLGRSTSSK